MEESATIFLTMNSEYTSVCLWTMNIQLCVYDKVSANVMISVQKMGESESGQIVF